VFPLTFFASFIGAVAPALMLLNVCFRSIPPLRRIFEENSQGVPGASYQQSMRGLRKIAAFLVPLALVVALIASVAP